MTTDAKLKWRRYDGGKLPEGKYLVGVVGDDGTITARHVASESFVSKGKYIAGPLDVEQPSPEPIAVVGAVSPPWVGCSCGGTSVHAYKTSPDEGIVILSVFADAPRDVVVRMFNAAAEVYNSLKAEEDENDV
jgi:hypothetical protein